MSKEKENDRKGRIQFAEEETHGAHIKVVGVGGGGGNAVSRMIASGLQGIEFISVNTDLQALSMSSSNNKVQIGAQLTGGLGSGGDPRIGRQAAEESIEPFAQASSPGGKWCPTSPRAAAPRIASITAWQMASPSECPFSPG